MSHPPSDLVVIDAPSGRPAPCRAILDTLGEDVVLGWFEAGDSQLQIAQRLGMHAWTVTEWLKTPESRFARYRAALAAGAEHFEQEAEEILKQAHKDALGNPGVAGALVSVAKERAQCAWRRAAVRDPARYDARRGGDTAVQVNIDNRRAERIEIVHIKPPAHDPAP